VSTAWVLDASALLCYLQAEDGYAEAKAIVVADRARNRVLLSAVTWSEVMHRVSQRAHLGGLVAVRHHLDLLHLDVVPLTQDRAEHLARMRSRSRLALADSAVAALAEELGGTIVTKDPDFHAVEDRIAVMWLPKARK